MLDGAFCSTEQIPQGLPTNGRVSIQEPLDHPIRPRSRSHSQGAHNSSVWVTPKLSDQHLYLSEDSKTDVRITMTLRRSRRRVPVRWSALAEEDSICRPVGARRK